MFWFEINLPQETWKQMSFGQKIGYAIRNNPGTFLFWIFLIFFVLPFFFWIRHVIRLSKEEDKTNMWVVLLLGIFLSFFTGAIVGSFMRSSKVSKQREREREREREQIFVVEFAILNIGMNYWVEKPLEKVKSVGSAWKKSSEKQNK